MKEKSSANHVRCINFLGKQICYMFTFLRRFSTEIKFLRKKKLLRYDKENFLLHVYASYAVQVKKKQKKTKKKQQLLLFVNIGQMCKCTHMYSVVFLGFFLGFFFC